jgi:hypothetical protein
MGSSPNVVLLAEAGDLVGNWSWTVWLLVPVTLVLALLTALCLGSGGEPSRARGGTGGVSRYLARTTDKEEVR